ncbi:MAG: hypothetical protein HC902_13000 [Calothrix sp. SM1_5_4]|nr:hypothetical protein [Calothrix sp. SM1_5_4]
MVTTAVVFLAGAGCTKVDPGFENLGDDNIPRPTFSGQTTLSLESGSETQTYEVSGECDSKIRSLTGAAVGAASIFNAVDGLTIAGVDVNCASMGTSGTFKFTLKSLKDLGFNPQEGRTYEIQLRGVTVGGMSKPSVIRIRYSAANGTRPAPVTVSAGGTRTASGGAYKAEFRVNFMTQEAPSSIGGSYKVKFGNAARYD